MTIMVQSVDTTGEKEKMVVLKEAEEKELVDGQQFVVPNFTVKQLLDAIPAHCFHRSALRSSLYIVQDFTLLAGLVYGAYHITPTLDKLHLSPATYWTAKIALYAIYQVLAGLVATGVWVIAHECGHQGFSSSKRINNSVGWVLHSALLVPYHSWRISHGRHHAGTNHLTRDEVHVPKTRKQLKAPEMKEEAEILGINVSAMRQAELREALEESPLASLWNVFLVQLVGWPMYLTTNASGQTHYPAGTNHFTPKAVIFRASQYWQVIWSDIGICLALTVLGYWIYKRGFAEFASIYLVPYLFVNHWLVLITFLQHTDPLIPHYSAEKWTFARGALATIDRNFLGPVGKYILHGICETHVAHHIASKIPHYNAWEATAALKTYLGPHYYESEENILAAFWRCHRECLFVEDGQDVMFFKNASGLAQRVPVEEGGNISDSGVDMGEK
ncbi:hypothetical protein TREMEDRAFT_45585 [Tremella mesenterica DSM 1558]|uniref:uncharacterized protein n=1 Tax=Tremella mesenterica (strain ATCC 24925 / CBS 8224 / DSM 1558 / NBRC 9311 / NRRL Y-6157 / RJB 2259-6 / UBC 559-6) TaxID=578456 RepID=UPI00032D3106|nr:uncharacterized protein TREMEDRAFT_45585 [Tremella mesenterica DSM 1558]EIW66753.1 hypothetical protein TREMEDRAFT_45585 [Tremella mesenterica DSM 1558]